MLSEVMQNYYLQFAYIKIWSSNVLKIVGLHVNSVASLFKF